MIARGTLTTLLVVSLAFNVTFAGTWLARRLGQEGPPAVARTNGNEPSVWAEADLDAEARQLVQESWGELGEEAVEIAAQIDEDRDRLFSLLRADEPDYDALVEVQQNIGDNQRRLREITVAKILETSRELDPEARDKWTEAMRRYAKERSPEKHWRSRTDGPFRGRPRHRRQDEVERLLESGAVALETVKLENGVEIRLRTEDDEGRTLLQERGPEWLREKMAPRREPGPPGDRTVTTED